MPGLNEILPALALCFSAPEPKPNAVGDQVFILADSLRLALRELPGGAGSVAWTEIAGPGRDPEESGKQAAEFLRIHLARFHQSGDAVGTRNEEGALILYVKLDPAKSREDCLESIRNLLNEAEAIRRIMGVNNRAGGSGMDGLLQNAASGLFRR